MNNDERTNMDRVTIDIDGGKLTLIRRTWSRGTSSRDMHKAPRMYVSVADGSVMEHLANRTRRPYNVYKTLIHASSLKGVLNLSKLSWDQFAGCTCHCSPGFVLASQSVTIEGETFYNWDAWLELDGAVSHVNFKKPALI
jgi:hypothetical protein